MAGTPLATLINQRVTQSFDENIHNIKVPKPKVVVPMYYNSKNSVEAS